MQNNLYKIRDILAGKEQSRDGKQHTESENNKESPGGDCGGRQPRQGGKQHKKGSDENRVERAGLYQSEHAAHRDTSVGFSRKPQKGIKSFVIISQIFALCKGKRKVLQSGAFFMFLTKEGKTP